MFSALTTSLPNALHGSYSKLAATHATRIVTTSGWNVTQHRLLHKKRKPNTSAGGSLGGGRVNVHNSLRRVLLSEETRRSILREEVKTKLEAERSKDQAPEEAQTSNLYRIDANRIDSLAYVQNLSSVRDVYHAQRRAERRRSNATTTTTSSSSSSSDENKNNDTNTNTTSNTTSNTNTTSKTSTKTGTKRTANLPWFVTDTMQGCVKRVWPVAQIIKGLPVDEALRQMQLCLRKPAKAIGTTLEKTIRYMRKQGIEDPSTYIVRSVGVNKAITRQFIVYHAKGRFGRGQHRASYVRFRVEPSKTLRLNATGDRPEESVFLMEELMGIRADKAPRLATPKRWTDTTGWKYVTKDKWTRRA